MKTVLLLTLAFAVLLSVQSVYSVPPPDPEHSFRHSQIVIEGKVLSVNIISEPIVHRTGDDDYYEQSGIAVYDVHVKTSLKNPDNVKTITVAGYFLREPHPMAHETLPYEIGEKVLLYLQENTHGDGGTDLIIRSSTSKTIDEFSDSLIPEPEQHMPLYEKCGSGATPQDGICVVETTKESPADKSVRWGEHAYNAISPLKQIQKGTALFDVRCSDDKIPAYKYDNMKVACVTEETHSKLVNRGWALLRFSIPDENPSQVLCNRYDGKWHTQYFGCRDITYSQCSLIGGVFVNNLRVCQDGTCPEKSYPICVTNMNLDIQYPDETKEQYDDRCRQRDTIRGPGPGPVECDSDLIECVYECGNDDIWHLFDKNGIKIDHDAAKKLVEQNEN